MNVKVVIAKEQFGSNLTRDTARLFESDFAGAPDVIHIIGGPDAVVVGAMEESKRRHLPVVYSPLGYLSSWYNPSGRGLHACANIPLITVASGAMEQEGLKGVAKNGLWLILNAVTTGGTTVEDMVGKYRLAYERAAALMERNIEAQIAKTMTGLQLSDAENSLLHEVLYARYLYERGSMPQEYKNKLSRLMKTADYDEDHFREVLNRLNIIDFMYLLQDLLIKESDLTEGFCPIIPPTSRQ